MSPIALKHLKEMLECYGLHSWRFESNELIFELRDLEVVFKGNLKITRGGDKGGSGREESGKGWSGKEGSGNSTIVGNGNTVVGSGSTGPNKSVVGSGSTGPNKSVVGSGPNKSVTGNKTPSAMGGKTSISNSNNLNNSISNNSGLNAPSKSTSTEAGLNKTVNHKTVNSNCTSPEGNERIYCVELDFDATVSSQEGIDFLRDIEMFLKKCDACFFMTYPISIDDEILGRPLSRSIEYLLTRK